MNVVLRILAVLCLLEVFSPVVADAQFRRGRTVQQHQFRLNPYGPGYSYAWHCSNRCEMCDDANVNWAREQQINAGKLAWTASSAPNVISAPAAATYAPTMNQNVGIGWPSSPAWPSSANTVSTSVEFATPVPVAPTPKGFNPSPQEAVNAMLWIANPQKGEVVYDLGCGDGRILKTAWEKYFALGVGIENNSEIFKLALKNVAGIPQIRIIEGDATAFDLSGADVITLYLNGDVMEKLVPKLRQLRAGVRVVSHNHEIPGVYPQRVFKLNGRTYYLYEPTGNSLPTLEIYHAPADLPMLLQYKPTPIVDAPPVMSQPITITPPVVITQQPNAIPADSAVTLYALANCPPCEAAKREILPRLRQRGIQVGFTNQHQYRSAPSYWLRAGIRSEFHSGPLSYDQIISILQRLATAQP